MIAKRLLCLFSAAAICLSLTSCWDYRGLDELTIVAGIAVDVDEDDPSLYSVSYEIVDPSSSQQSGQTKSKLITSTGRTITESIHSANKQLYSELYFGNTELLIISHKLAEKEGINDTIEAMFRDNSIRDNLIVTIARTETAKEIIQPDKDSNTIISYNVNEHMSSERKTSNSIKFLELYRIYDIIKLEHSSLVLPAIRKTKEAEEAEYLLDGVALFQKDKLDSFLVMKEMRLLMFVTEKLSGGSFTFFLKGSENDKERYSVRILQSTPKLGYKIKDKKLTLTVDLTLLCSAVEISLDFDELNGKTIRQLEHYTGDALSLDVKTFIKKTQKEAGNDIFGFGAQIYENDPELWNQIKGNWKELFSSAEIKVKTKCTINDTGLIKNY